MCRNSISFCLYALCILCSLIACGTNTPSGITSSATYIANDRDKMIVITWQRTGETLQGEWISREMPDLRYFSPSKPQKMLWSGQVQDETTFSMTVGGSLLEGNVEGEHLTLRGSTSTGTFQQATWQRISQAQANQYSEAFDAYAQARLAFAALRYTVASPPLESKVSWYAGSVFDAERYVQRLGENRDRLVGLKQMCGTMLLSQFWFDYPPTASQFVLSSVEKGTNTGEENARATLEASTIWKQLQAYREAWRVAEGKAVPQVDGVVLPWRIHPQELPWPQEQQQQTEGSAQKVVDDLKSALKVDYQSMKDLKKQAKDIGTEVENLAQRQGCPRG